ncbi:hypothetical protein CLOHAE12215_01462 [Clostridium haemolyticum]|uniref:hypothetical protein n=1 Tax=Clostridium haemolyticum TaxID=84025 RepID=UPI001C3B37FA|nr:hypothetical protein [Clostridium haemolyticum]CAG7840046.1 hypothetical protein CLOHAE12215_01462 [Clostridium haemolyticum]
MNNNNLIGIVNKPQFDTNVFEVGKAVHIKQIESNGYKSLDADCIIIESTPLCLQGIYYNKQKEDTRSIEILITNFVDGIFEISLLKEDI